MLPTLGFFIQPVHPPRRPYAQVLREDREAVTLADSLEFREAFIGEHLADRAETITSSLCFIASLAERCRRIVFGTGVLALPNYHPVMAASQIAMVDHLVDGRLMLGVGPGVAPDAEALGDLGSHRAEKLQEGLEHLLRIWAEDPPYDIEGEFYHTTTRRTLSPEIGAGKVILPLQRPHPPILITAMRPESSGPGAAGRRGWGGISAAYSGAHVVRAHIDNFMEGRRAAGLSADASGWKVARSIFVADDEATARRYARAADGAHGFYFHVMRTKLAGFGSLSVMHDRAGDPVSELEPNRTLERLVIAGTPQQVADRVLEFRERTGPFGTLLYTGHDWVHPALARRSMQLMAEKVWPRVIAGL